MFKKMKNKSVLLSWGFSYLVFIFITVTIITALYLSTVKTLKAEITTSNDLLLNNIQNQIDSVIKGSKLLSTEIGINKSINRLQYMEGTYNTINPYAIYEAHYTLQNYYRANPSIKNIYIYYKKSDILLSNTNANSSKNFYDIFFDGTISYTDWEKIFKQKYDSSAFIMEPSNNDYLFTVTSYPFMSYNDNFMTVIVELNKDMLFVKLDESSKLNSSSFFMLSREDQVLQLSTNSNNFLNGTNYEDLSWQEPYTERKIENENIIFSYIPSNQADWKYVVAMPEKIFWQHSRDLFKLTLLGILSAIIIGGIVMHFSLHYNYVPINELLYNLENKYGYHFNKNYNEYYFIKHSFDNVATEQKRTKALLKIQNQALSSAILSRLIRGNTTQLSNAKDILFNTELNINFENYGIILFHIESFEGINSDLSTHKNLEILEEYNISQFILNNVASEVISKKVKFISTEVDNIIVYVISIEPELTENVQNTLIALTDEIKSFIDSNYDFDITTAVSKIHHDLSTVSDCFYEALEIMEYKHILGSDSNTVYKNTEKIISSTEFYYPTQKEHLLIQGIKRYDFEGVKSIIEDLFKQNINTTQSILELHFCVMLAIIGTLIKTISDMKNANTIEILSYLEIIKRVKKCNTSSNIKTETLYIAEYIINSIKKIEHSDINRKEDEIVHVIVKFVEENYALLDLSVSYIADDLQVNAVQMSKLFRNAMSESLPDYINKCRITHAKSIMKNGYTNLEELAVQVGYSNTKTLTRAFKKYVGVPPGQYKDIMN